MKPRRVAAFFRSEGSGAVEPSGSIRWAITEPALRFRPIRATIPNAKASNRVMHHKETSVAPRLLSCSMTIMNLEPSNTIDMRVKHLEMVQSIVSRMAGYSATLKNYCLTITVAICGFAVSAKEPLVLASAVIPIVVFALLDAQYLRLERQFRSIFDEIRKGDWSKIPDFEINLRKAPKVFYIDVLISWSIGIFYIPLGVSLVVFTIISSVIL